MSDAVVCPLCRQPWATHYAKCRPMLELEFAGQTGRVDELMRIQAAAAAQADRPAEGEFRFWHVPIVWALQPIMLVIRFVDWLRSLGRPDPERDSFPWGGA